MHGHINFKQVSFLQYNIQLYLQPAFWILSTADSVANGLPIIHNFPIAAIACISARIRPICLRQKSLNRGKH
jgi:hypothetical protein